jgi:hypothetical protein
VESSPPAAVGDRFGRPFVGREHELAELRASLVSALAGSARLVLVGGEPGIGKTRLAATLAAEAGERGIPVWLGWGWQDGTAQAFWPWNAALRRGMERAGDEEVLAAAGPLVAELGAVFPVLGERMPAPAVRSPWESDQARLRLFDAVSRFLAQVARRAGLVVVLDDAQWADLASLKLLEFVAADLPDARLLVIATYRDTEVRRGQPFFATLSRLARETVTRRLMVRGLSPEDCVRYVSLAGADGEAEPLGLQLHHETDGNAFLLGELVELLAGEGRLTMPWSRTSLPPSVREVVSQRLDGVDEHRRVLPIAALLGEIFDREQVARVLATAGRGAAAAVAAVLDRAVRDRIVGEVEGAPGRFAFSHALVRHVLIDELDASAQAAWHACIADDLERTAGERRGAAAGEIVHHLVASGSTDGLRKAFVHARLGAEAAARRLGWEEAARLYTIALDAGERCGLLEVWEAIELELAEARALARSGDLTGARARCRDASVRCRSLDRPDLLAWVALLLADCSPNEGGVAPDARALLEEASRRREALADPLRATLCARLASDIVARDEVEQMDRAGRLSSEAVRAARAAGHAGALAAAGGVARDARRLIRGPMPAAEAEPLPSYAELAELAESAGELERAARLRHRSIVAHLAMGDGEAFWAEHEAFTALAASSRVPEALWLAAGIGAMRAFLEGRFDDGRRASEQALELARRMHLTRAEGAYLSQQIMGHALRGRLAEVRPALVESVTRPEMMAWRPFLAIAHLAAGDTTAARTELATLLASGFARAERGLHASSYLAGLAALAIGLRAREHAAMLSDLVDRQPDRWAVTGWAAFGPWALARGSLARLAGRPREAVAAFEEAIHLGRRLRARPVVAQAQTLLADVLASGDPDASVRARAAALLAEAEPDARALGLADALRRIEHVRSRWSPSRARDRSVFRREGDYWTVRWAGAEVRLKDARGLGHLATLLGAPGREIHVLELAAAPNGTEVRGVPEAGLRVGRLASDGQPGPDARARWEYRSRVRELRAELEEAERFGDLGQTERLRLELEHVTAQLARRFAGRGLGAGPAERARKAVTKAIRAQLAKLLDVHPVLGRHLSATVRMGTVCVYAPAGRVDWDT